MDRRNSVRVYSVLGTDLGRTIGQMKLENAELM